jgi:hypothetical protein
MAGKLRGLLTRHDWGRVDQVAAEEAARLAHARLVGIDLPRVEIEDRTMRITLHLPDRDIGQLGGQKLRGLLTRHDWGRVDQVAAEEAARLA